LGPYVNLCRVTKADPAETYQADVALLGVQCEPQTGDRFGAAASGLSLLGAML
jgi:hypothetical protein